MAAPGDPMATFLQQIMALPTVVYTALLGLVFVYWIFVIVGALDVDMVDVGVDLDGVAEGAAEGAADGALDAAGDTASGLQDGFSLLGFMSWMGLRNAPFTVVFSLIILLAWGACMLGMRYVAPALGGGVLAGAVVAGGAFVLAAPITGVVARPLGPLFNVKEAEGRRDFIGYSCVIETGAVDERFGVATVQEGGRWPRIEVRASSPNALRRGDEALIVDYDEADETFRVEALSPPKGKS